MNLRRIAASLVLGLALLAGPALAVVTLGPIPQQGSPFWITEAINDTITPMNQCQTNKGAGEFEAGLAYTAESTAVYQLRPGEQVYAAIKLDPAAGDTTTYYAFAVQIRAHIPFYRYTKTGVARSYASDSTAALNTGWPLASSDSASIVPWLIRSPGNTGANSSDSANAPVSGNAYYQSTNTSFLGQVNSRTLWPQSERYVYFPPWGRANSWFGNSNREILLPLTTSGYPAAFWAPYFSVRIRCVYGPASGKPRVIMHLLRVPTASTSH